MSNEKCPQCGCYLSHDSTDSAGRPRFCPNHGEVRADQLLQVTSEEKANIAATNYKAAFEETIDERDDLRRQLAALQAIVNKLPKTADGVPVVPGMRVWPLHEIEDEEGGRICMAIYDLNTGETQMDGDTADIRKSYSTREAAKGQAAQAAKEANVQN